jgi:hypothetical protein
VDQCIKNEWGIIGLPVYLVIMVIIVSCVIGILSYGIQEFQMTMQSQQIDNQIDMIISQAELLYASSFEGSSIVLEVEFPDYLDSIVFGGCLTGNSSIEDMYIHNDRTEKTCCYLLDDNQMNIRHTSIRFVGENITKPSILHEGGYLIRLETIIISGDSYIKISQV